MLCILRVWCALALILSIEAAPHRPRLFPNPNIVILGIAGDSHGELWLAAEDGLYHFDGVHYQRIPGLPVDHIRYVAVTKDDVIWVAGTKGLVRYDGHFRLVTGGDVTDFWAWPDHLLIRVLKVMMQIGLDGSITHLPFTPQSKPFGIDSSGSLWQGFLISNEVCHFTPDDLTRPRRYIDCLHIPRGIRLTYTLPDALGRLWVADENQAVHYEGDREVLSVERLPGKEQWRPGPLVRGNGKTLWFIGETSFDLSGANAFRTPEEDQRYLPTAGYEDRQGHLWVADRGKGLVEWTQDATWNRWFTEDFARQPVHAVFRSADGAILASTHKGFYRLEDGRWTPIHSAPLCCSFVLPEADGTLLTAIRGIGPVRLSQSGAILARFSGRLTFDSFRKIVRDSDGSIWVASRQMLFRMGESREALTLDRVPLPDEASPEAGVMDIKRDSTGRLWVGYGAGLAWKDQSGVWNRITTDRPLGPVRGFAFEGQGDGDGIWVAYREQGLHVHLRRDGNVWRITEYAPEPEFGSDDTRFLERDSRGWIWRGTMDGVYVSNGHDGESGRWLHLNRPTGLSVDQTDEYGFFEDQDGSVWISGADGVSHISPDPAWFSAPHSAPAPRITRLELDGVEYLQPQGFGSAPAKKSLRLEFSSIFASPFRDSPLAYRLISDRSRDAARAGMFTGSLEFANLPYGRYTLTVSYAGSDSPPATFHFQAGANLWWPWLGGVALGSTFLAWTLRHSLAMEKVRYRVSKLLFIVKQRRRRPRNEVGERLPKEYAGQILRGRFLMNTAISRSDFSTVYDAHDVRHGQRVAVKILRPQNVQEGRARDKFALEIAALQSIDHPGIVSILDWWINPSGEGSIAMPFLEGPTLRTALQQQGPLARRRVARLLRQLSSALAEIHARGIVHRDLKPENIILAAVPNAEERAVLLDFGAAGFRAAEDQLALTASPAGTFYYLAPERLSGHYAPASDVYALGVIALEVLSGKRLFDLGAVYSSASFSGELATALRASLGETRHAAAGLLRPCFDPDPAGRPRDVLGWAESFAAIVDHDSFLS